MSKIVCKICIAQKGLKGKDLFEGKCDYALGNEEDFMNHLEQVHKYKIIKENDKQKQNSRGNKNGE